jgi:hypothetical protein
MSIVRQLLQISAVEALRGRTLAKGNVHDSAIDSIDGALENGRLPIIIVSIEEADQRGSGNERGFFDRTSEYKMQVQVAIFELTTVAVEGGGEDELAFSLGETDAALEGMLNILDREWRAALTDPRNAWGDVLRGLVLRIGRVQDMRAADPELPRRHAMRLAQVEMVAIGEPAPGEDVPPAIEAGLTLLEADADYVEMATKWRELLTAGAALEDWEKRQASSFASRAEVNALGYGPLDDEALTDFDQATLEVAGLAGSVVVTAEGGDDD